MEIILYLIPILFYENRIEKIHIPDTNFPYLKFAFWLFG